MVIGSDLDDGDDDDASGRPIKASVLCLKATFIQGLLTMAFSLILTFFGIKTKKGSKEFWLPKKLWGICPMFLWCCYREHRISTVWLGCANVHKV